MERFMSCSLFYVGGNFLLFFIMFGKYRLPRELFSSSQKSRREKFKSEGKIKCGNLLRYNLIIIHFCLVTGNEFAFLFPLSSELLKRFIYNGKELLHRLNTRLLYSISRARNHRHYRFGNKRKPYFFFAFISFDWLQLINDEYGF